MPKKTLTRLDLAKSLHQEIGMSVNDGSYFVNEVLDNIARSLINGGEVKISNFGIFSIRQKKERIGRNPKTNEKAVISPRKVVVFKASQNLKGQVTAQPK